MAELNDSKGWQGGPLFHQVKKWKNGTESRGPTGRSKSRSFNKFRKELVKQVHLITVWCNDQHGNQGTGHRGKFTGKIKGVNISHVAPQAA